MSTFGGVAILAPERTTLERLAALRVTPAEPADRPALYVAIDTLRPDVLARFAREAVARTDATAFVLLGQTSVDVYLVDEIGPQGSIRRVEGARDANPKWTGVGAPRPWEIDLHLGQPLDELVDDLGDAEWSDDDIALARAAHAARDLDRLPRLPSPSRRRFGRLAASLGVDLERPGARWKPPGFFARLFGG